jgi:hypothetical protein
VTFDEGIQIAERIGANAFVHMSVKDNINCELAFFTLARLIHQYRGDVAAYASKYLKANDAAHFYARVISRKQKRY